MGAYLSEPVKEKVTEEGQSEAFTFAATSMQGWRVNQEDAHNAIVDFAKGTSLFAVYDGHGGSEVSQYVAERFPSFLKEQKAWREGLIGEALTNGFLDFDAHIITPGAVTELKRMAGQEEISADQEGDPEETAEERRMLVEEAQMPIAELFEKYGILKKMEEAMDGATAFVSPNIGRRARKTKPSPDGEDDMEPPSLDESSDKEDSQPGEKRKKPTPSPKKSPKKVKENGSEMVAKKAKVERNGSSEEVGFREEAESRERWGSLQASVAETCEAKVPLRSPVGSPTHRQRNSKSESEVRTLKAEEEAAGPISNWKAMGVAGGTRESGRETPETATAASSGDEEKAEDEESEEDETWIAPEVEADSESGEEDAESTQGDEEGSDEEEEEQEEDEDEEEEFPMPSGDSPGVDSGTTACVVVVSGQSLYVANAGDSRCVLSRAGKALDLSEDHKPEDPSERSRIEAAGGKITPDGRVNGGLNLSRALGDHFYKRTSGLPLAKQMISPLPDIRVESISPEDDFFVLACDGIWNSMESQDVVDFVRTRMEKGETLPAIAEAMCDHCLAPDASGDGTGCDNMTVIITRLNAPKALNGDHANGN